MASTIAAALQYIEHPSATSRISLTCAETLVWRAPTSLFPKRRNFHGTAEIGRYGKSFSPVRLVSRAIGLYAWLWQTMTPCGRAQPGYRAASGDLPVRRRGEACLHINEHKCPPHGTEKRKL